MQEVSTDLELVYILSGVGFWFGSVLSKRTLYLVTVWNIVTV